MNWKSMLKFFGLLVVSYISTLSFSSGQSPDKKSAFDSNYYYIATALSAKDVNEAINRAESLLQTAEDSLQRVRSLMLLATLNERTGKHVDAIKFAIRGEKLAEKIGNTQWQTRIAGFLSTTFREVGLTGEGKKYIALAETFNNQSKASPLFKVFIHQEKAYYEIESGNYRKALSEIYHAIQLVEELPPGKGNSIISATSYQVAGFCHMNLDSLARANDFLNRSLSALGDEESELKGFIYQNLGELNLKQKKYEEAFRYLEMALKYTASSKNFNLQLHTYQSLDKYYSDKGDSKNAKKYQSMYTQLVETRSAMTKNVSNDLIEKLGYELEVKTTNNNILYFVTGGLLLAILFSVSYFISSRRKERKKYLAYITKLIAQKTTIPVTTEKIRGEEVPENNKKDGLLIPKETEERVLNDLAALEKEGFYLNNDVNMSYLSAALKVNSKYLSAIINNHKGKDFNNYINELRVNYIIEKLQGDEKYLEYKIAYLSQESGFSTHSKFTTAFKNVTGISPSAFITNIKKDKG